MRAAEIVGAAFGALALVALARPLLAGADESPPRGLLLQPRAYGSALTDSDGMTLYTYLKDEPGKSNCLGHCAQAWLPVVADHTVTPPADWSVITRGDSTLQWAFHDMPLYRSIRDTFPGDTNGEEFAGLWQAARQMILTPPGFGFFRTSFGLVLSGDGQRTLYTNDGDKPHGSSCDKECRRSRIPVDAPALAHAFGEWTILDRGDGTRQWALRSKPLYRYDRDIRAGDVTGQGKGWHPVVLESAPPVPSWVTIGQTDAGEVFADAQGRTLYTFNPEGRGQAATASELLNAAGRGNSGTPEVKNDASMVDWVPVIAELGAERVGSWVPIPRSGDTQQWTYRGLALFTNTNDIRPGDILGVRSSDLRFTTVTPSGAPMQGIAQ